MKLNNYVYIRFHKSYNISIIVVFDFKYNQQYVDFFKILKKIDRLIYRLNLFNH